MYNSPRWETYTPFGVGLDDFFRQLDKLHDSGSNFPKYNIITNSEDSHTIEIALAGYNQDQLEVAVEKNILTVKGKKEEEDNRNYAHRGLALRNFERSWQLGEDVLVGEPTFANGLLSIELTRQVPEERKRKVLPINTHIEKLEAALNV